MLTLRLKELDLELGRQDYETQLEAPAFELEADRQFWLRLLPLLVRSLWMTSDLRLTPVSDHIWEQQMHDQSSSTCF
ncbi:hypothetical protein GJAV_G00052530 [Gymnothorax javanicus]|nr:hypothetical protein GJAV_G00052530 [Gymnothorax javanicus]